MKTKRYTAAVLTALIFASVSIQAQSARRTANQQKKEITTQKANNTRTARKVQSAQVRSTQNRNSQQARNAQSSQVRRPVSMTTTNNPRSTYRNPTNVRTAEPRSTAVRNTSYRNKSYFGGIHYHYAYPTRKVNIHYHYNTYVNHYRVLYYPTFGHIYWTRSMYRDYHRWYPEFQWRYNYGYRIQTISVFDAKYNLGEVAMVYGRVYASWYNNETDDYLFFFGGDFPYQEFTAVVPGHVARRFGRRPDTFFLGQHVTITGLITTYDGSPEIVVKNRSQLRLY